MAIRHQKASPEAGFTLAEVVIAAGLMGFVALIASKNLELASNQSKYVMSKAVIKAELIDLSLKVERLFKTTTLRSRIDSPQEWLGQHYIIPFKEGAPSPYYRSYDISTEKSGVFVALRTMSVGNNPQPLYTYDKGMIFNECAAAPSNEAWSNGTDSWALLKHLWETTDVDTACGIYASSNYSLNTHWRPACNSDNKAQRIRTAVVDRSGKVSYYPFSLGGNSNNTNQRGQGAGWQAISNFSCLVQDSRRLRLITYTAVIPPFKGQQPTAWYGFSKVINWLRSEFEIPQGDYTRISYIEDD